MTGPAADFGNEGTARSRKVTSTGRVVPDRAHTELMISVSASVDSDGVITVWGTTKTALDRHVVSHKLWAGVLEAGPLAALTGALLEVAEWTSTGVRQSGELPW